MELRLTREDPATLRFVLESLAQGAISDEELGLWACHVTTVLEDYPRYLLNLVDYQGGLGGPLKRIPFTAGGLPAAARKGLRLVARARAGEVAWKEVPADVLADFRSLFPFVEVPDVRGRPPKPERSRLRPPRKPPVALQVEAGRARFQGVTVVLLNPNEQTRAETLLGALDHWESEARHYAAEELLDVCQEAWDGSATEVALAEDLKLREVECGDDGEVCFSFSSGYFQGHLVLVTLSGKNRFTSATIAG